jgi:ParB-like chromosome segregation protein Spo0J
MTASRDSDRLVPVEQLGERLSALRLCDRAAVEAMQRSLGRYGQLTAVVTFDEGGSLEVVDGFKRLHAARQLGWTTLGVRQCDVSPVDAKVQLAALHAGYGLTELEEGWLVRSLYRDDGLSQPAIAARLGRHKSWVCRRLMLVEALDTEVQARVRLGLVMPRAAVALAALPRGNQVAVSDVVARRGLTVRQTELLVAQLGECDGDPARDALIARWASGAVAPSKPGVRPSRALRSEADWMAADVAMLHRVAARLEARLLGTPLRALGPTAAEVLAESLDALGPVLAALTRTITAVTARRGRTAPHKEESAA